MSEKQLIIDTIMGKNTGRPVWSPFLAYWWENQPTEIQKAGQFAFMKQHQFDPVLRGFCQSWQTTLHGVEKREFIKNDRKYEELETPVGKLVKGYHYSEKANTWFLVDHPVKTAEDLKVLMWIYEHMTIAYDRGADLLWQEVGDDGLVLPLVGTEMKTCFQSLVESWVGTENLAYLLADEPEAVEECLAVMRNVSDRSAVLSTECACEGFIFWEDSSTTNISPAMFEKYTMPEITAWGNILHQGGKFLVHHACGHLKALLPLMGKLPIDAIESISPPPTGNIDIEDAFKLIPENIALIGGIEPVFFANCTMEALEARVDELLRISKGRRYIMANSDSCPPEVSLEKLIHVGAYLRSR